uniref:Uncharacterized protein n=1 Tax=Salix viminalis TaxID=40686 RepID=A0A6N2KSE2_SALVM
MQREKDMLRDSQPQSFELIRRLELHVKQLSEACTEDKKHIQKLERELLNCSQEIGSTKYEEFRGIHPGGACE